MGGMRRGRAVGDRPWPLKFRMVFVTDNEPPHLLMINHQLGRNIIRVGRAIGVRCVDHG